KNQWRISRNFWLFGLLIIGLAAMFTTGSRTPIWGLIGTFPLVLVIWRYAGFVSVGNLAKVICAGVVITVAAQLVAADAFEADSYRQGHATDAVGRVLSPFTESYGAMQTMGPLGWGIGSTNSGAATIMGSRDYWWLDGNLPEVEPARVLAETGIIGFVLVYAA